MVELRESRNARYMYEELVSRNIGILTPENQNKIRSSNVLIVGCGLGSVIAELSVRTGFEKLILVDGDTVELSNLNRQIYSIEDVGENKAIATARALKAINPAVSLEVYPSYLGVQEIPQFVSKADIIVDAVDISALQLILALHKTARVQGKEVFFPLNLGWGSGLFIFSGTSKTLAEMLGIDDVLSSELKSEILESCILPKWANLLVNYLPWYLLPLFNSFMGEVRERGWCPVPQLGVASFLTAGLTVAAMVRSVLGLSLKYAPEINTLDALVALD